ncbi:MAG: diaminopimelate epimerase [Nanoarchaeota archaeon]|nr:diaminopimelate epimerase [Nanoarchaeota archaeon]
MKKEPVPFAKMHGLGNDFVVINCLEKNYVKNPEQFAKDACRRQFGIGADGVIMILPSKKADFKMRIMNADGSEAEMCGNGIRCFAKYLIDRKLTDKSKFTVETLAGIITPEVHGKLIKADMGEPVLERSKIPMKGAPGTVIDETLMLKDRTVNVTAVSMGNPHAVIFVDTFNIPLQELGREIETHPSFPNKTNVEFATIVNKKEIAMCVWERGVGVTMACGTGACATLVAAVLNGKTNRRATLHLLGGDLEIEWAENNHVYLTGPAEEIFTAEYLVK